jgi:hypothetical protein
MKVFFKILEVQTEDYPSQCQQTSFQNGKRNLLLQESGYKWIVYALIHSSATSHHRITDSFDLLVWIAKKRRNQHIYHHPNMTKEPDNSHSLLMMLSISTEACIHDGSRSNQDHSLQCITGPAKSKDEDIE